LLNKLFVLYGKRRLITYDFKAARHWSSIGASWFWSTTSSTISWRYI